MTVMWVSKMPPSNFPRNFRCEGVGIACRVLYIKSSFKQGPIRNMWFGTLWTDPLAGNRVTASFFGGKTVKRALKCNYLVNAWSNRVHHSYKVSYPWHGAFRGANRSALSITVTDFAPQPNRYITGNCPFWPGRSRLRVESLSNVL